MGAVGVTCHSEVTVRPSPRFPRPRCDIPGSKREGAILSDASGVHKQSGQKRSVLQAMWERGRRGGSAFGVSLTGFSHCGLFCLC